VLIQSPNFFGTIEDVDAVAEIAHKHGAMLAVSIAEAISLGIVEPPRQADIIAMEAQSFGVPLAFGGPYCGVIATREKFVRQMPGRLVGQTTDRNSKRGFVLTLATREQHIRREKATSNICTAQALNALGGVVYLTWLGRRGIVELGELLLARTHYARETLAALDGVEKLHEQPVIREFALRLDADVAAVKRRCAEQGVNPGVDVHALSGREDDRGVLLVAITERRTRAEIDRLANVLGAAVAAALSPQGERQAAVAV
jgi:glycine dehydrogenase subunit 1